MSRRISATILGGLGGLFLGVGLIVLSVFGFVSSADAARQSVESLMSDSSIRRTIADEVVTAIEDSGDTPQERVVFSLARPLIEDAVSRAINSPRLQTFFGEVSFTAYEVFVDERPTSKIDVSPVIDVAVDAIKKIDPRIAKNFTPKVEPLTLERDANSPDLKGIRNSVRIGMWAFVIVGVLLEIGAWFLATADNATKVRRLGIRIALVGVAVLLVALIARQVIPGFSQENGDLVAAVTRFVTEPVLVRGILVAVIGITVAGAGWFQARRTSHPLNRLDSVKPS